MATCIAFNRSGYRCGHRTKSNGVCGTHKSWGYLPHSPEFVDEIRDKIRAWMNRFNVDPVAGIEPGDDSHLLAFRELVEEIEVDYQHIDPVVRANAFGRIGHQLLIRGCDCLLCKTIPSYK